LSPSSFTIDFVRFAAEFGAEIEIRTGWLTQDLPHWVRMLDLDSRWSWNNGLPTLVPTLLQMSMTGYPFVLPDMIGGNNYGNDEITKELFIRWVQATVFMPAMQFSFTPWDFDAETIVISKWCTDMHETYTDYIVERFRLVVRTGELVNSPIWWLDPDDVEAQAVDDEFLLGDKILSAPVVIQGAVTRDIYLPQGKWRDGNTGELHDGRKRIKDYPAPLNILPYFIRED
jgi:myogenesis-regulating glycosidase